MDDERNDYDENPYGEDMVVDEDLSALEDDSSHPSDSLSDEASGHYSDANLDELSPDTPLYRLKLSYSHETFLASFQENSIAPRTMVVVPTRYGKDLAEIIGRVKNPGAFNPSEIIRVDRVASDADLERSRIDAEREREAFLICREKIEAHKLDMKLVSVHYLLEESKILFFFTAENRVDFRELVKDLVGIFKTRIELRQIGVRDESRVVGGLGVCGRGYCCHTVSDKLKPVSIKMAKDQNLSLNSMKISGPCGRLLCCLAYEHGFYHEVRRAMPPEGCRLNHQGVNWKVIEVNPVSGKLRMAGDDGRQAYISSDRFERVEGRWRLREDAFRDIEQTSSHTR